MNGKEALKKIRETERFANTPVILFTTSSQANDKDFARQYNAGLNNQAYRFSSNETDRRYFYR